TGEVDAVQEPADIAVADGDVLPVRSADAACLRSIARSQATELETIAIDGDVVGADDNRAASAGADVGAQVRAQAPHALGGDDRGHRIDESGAVVVGLCGAGRPGRGQQEDGQEQDARQCMAEYGHWWLRWR